MTDQNVILSNNNNSKRGEEMFEPSKKKKKRLAQPRKDRIICLDIGEERKARLTAFCKGAESTKTEMIKQMIDYCLDQKA